MGIPDKQAEWASQRADRVMSRIFNHDPYDCPQGFHKDCLGEIVYRALLDAYRRGAKNGLTNNED